MQPEQVGAQVRFPALRDGSITHGSLRPPLIKLEGAEMIDKTPSVQGQKEVSGPKAPCCLDSQEVPEHPQAPKEKTTWRPVPLLLLRDVTGNTG